MNSETKCHLESPINISSSGQFNMCVRMYFMTDKTFFNIKHMSPSSCIYIHILFSLKSAGFNVDAQMKRDQNATVGTRTSRWTDYDSAGNLKAMLCLHLNGKVIVRFRYTGYHLLTEIECIDDNIDDGA